MGVSLSFVKQYIRATAIIFFLCAEAAIVVELIKHMK
jgi:hypothetical protein